MEEGLLNADSIDWLATRMQELHNEELIAHGPTSRGVTEPPVWNGYWIQSCSDWRVTAAGRADDALYRERLRVGASGARLPITISAPAEPGIDLFISHASEDKDDVARPLALALTAKGWTVWLDELELTVGDSLSRTIDSALVRSRFGVVILSPAFFSKDWAQRELAGLAAREVDAGTKVILPVWHNVDRRYIVQQSPVLADRLRALTILGIEDVATKLSAALRKAGTRSTFTGDTELLVQSVESATEDSVSPLAIPITSDDQARIIANRPRFWEYQLFAGVLAQGKNELEPKWHDHELRLSRGARRDLEDLASVSAFVSREMAWLVTQVDVIMRVLNPRVTEQAFGPVGEPGDPVRIQHLAPPTRRYV
jgi:hypothetical protein